MSITSILSGKNFPKLRTKLKTDFPRPSIILKGELIAPPITDNYAIVGAAFDYACRFVIEQENIGNDDVIINSSDSLIAKRVIERIESKYEKKPVKRKLDKDLSGLGVSAHKAMIDFHYNRDLEKFEIFQNSKIEIYNSVEIIENFRSGGKASDEFYQACIVFAKLDLLARAGIMDDTLCQVVQEDIEDIKKLIEVLPNTMRNPKSRVVLNPTLPIGGVGADGDLIIDNKLIDIKTTKNLKIDRVVLNQIICYYTGYLESEKYKEMDVDEIGIYFSRHGLLWSIKTSELGTDDKFLKFGKWFKNYLDTRNPMEKESPNL